MLIGRLTLFTMLLMLSSHASAQEVFPLYQQFAFDFFNRNADEMLPSGRMRKIAVRRQFEIFYGNQHYANTCIDIESKSYQDSIFSENYAKFLVGNLQYYGLDFSDLDKSKFKIRRENKYHYPRMTISPPDKYGDRIFLEIDLERSSQTGTFYVIEMNQLGVVVDWCSESYEIVICR
jgi:hypothetical protein